jgi:cytidyltransferase-like protein
MYLSADSISKVLSAVTSIQIERGFTTVSRLAERLLLGTFQSRDIVSSLLKMGLLVRRGSKIYISDSGRRMIRVVMTGGVFDLIHVGHMATLEEARRLGDMLVVVVARDTSVQRAKGRKPVNGELSRLRVVRGLRSVDAAVLGNRGDMYRVALKLRPDVIALGYDQEHSEMRIARELRSRELRTQVKRLKVQVPGVKTSNIMSLIGSQSILRRGRPRDQAKP